MFTYEGAKTSRVCGQTYAGHKLCHSSLLSIPWRSWTNEKLAERLKATRDSIFQRFVERLPYPRFQEDCRDHSRTYTSYSRNSNPLPPCIPWEALGHISAPLFWTSLSPQRFFTTMQPRVTRKTLAKFVLVGNFTAVALRGKKYFAENELFMHSNMCG